MKGSKRKYGPKNRQHTVATSKISWSIEWPQSATCQAQRKRDHRSVPCPRRDLLQARPVRKMRISTEIMSTISRTIWNSCLSSRSHRSSPHLYWSQSESKKYCGKSWDMGSGPNLVNSSFLPYNWQAHVEPVKGPPLKIENRAVPV